MVFLQIYCKLLLYYKKVPRWNILYHFYIICSIILFYLLYISCCSCSVHLDFCPSPTREPTLRLQTHSSWYHLVQPPPTRTSINSTVTSGSCASSLRELPVLLRLWVKGFLLFWWPHCTLCWRRLERRACWLARQLLAVCGVCVRHVDTPHWRSWSTKTLTTSSMTSLSTCRGSVSTHRYEPEY